MDEIKKITVTGTFPEEEGKNPKFKIQVKPVLTEESTMKEIGDYLTLSLSGFTHLLNTCLQCYPMLREPLALETENNIYVFENDKENNLYKSRKALYEQIANVFNDILHTNFADIEYITKCDAAIQQYIFENANNTRAIDDYKKDIKKTVKEVRKTLLEMQLKAQREAQEALQKEQKQKEEKE